MRRARNIWTCKACGKRAYPTESRAYEAIENHHTYHGGTGRQMPKRAYPCQYGNGWHLTSQEERSTA